MSHGILVGCLIAGSLLPFRPFEVDARSVLEGLEIVESEKGGGVEILTISPSCPAAQAMLQAGDRIVSIGGKRISNLDDYVTVSKRIKDKEKRVIVGYYRDGVRRRAGLSLYRAPLQGEWGLNIITWREPPPPGGGDPSDFWMGRAKRQIRDSRRKSDEDLKPEDYGRAILSLFTALEASPDSLSTAALIARQYVELAGLYRRGGEKGKVIWCLRRALLLYSNSVRKAGNVHEMVVIKNGLKEMGSDLDY